MLCSKKWLGMAGLMFAGAVSVGNVVAQEKEPDVKPVQIQTIELFVMSGTPVVLLDVAQYPNIKAILHVVDEADVMKIPLNKMLKKVNNESDARKLMQPYFKDKAFVQRLQRAFLSQHQAKRYQLKSYPAAVINRGEGLVSGHVDMNRIVDLVRAKRGLGQ